MLYEEMRMKKNGVVVRVYDISNGVATIFNPEMYQKNNYVIPGDELRIYYDKDEENEELVKCAKETEVDYLSFTRVHAKNIHYLV